MKVCQIYEDFVSPAKDSMGAERVCESITKGLIKLGHEVVMRVHPSSLSSVAPMVNEVPTDCDILHFHQWNPTNPNRNHYTKYNKPWIVTIHGGGTETDPNWLKTTYKNPHVVCISNFISQKIGCPSYVWNGSSPENFIYKEQKQNYIIWMAGTDWQTYFDGKGLWLTIALAKKLKFKFIIAGTGNDKRVIEKIKNLCDNNIKYIGVVNGKEKAEYIANAKAFIIPTQLPEACTTTFSESMLSGTPVIASNFGAMPELVIKDVGFVCKNETDYVKAIINVSKIDPKKCLEYGMKEFSDIAMAKKYIKLYENVLQYGTVSP